MSPLLKNVILIDCSNPNKLEVISQGKAVLPVIGYQFNLGGKLAVVCQVRLSDRPLEVYEILIKYCSLNK